MADVPAIDVAEFDDSPIRPQDKSDAKALLDEIEVKRLFWVMMTTRQLAFAARHRLSEIVSERNLPQSVANILTQAAINESAGEVSWKQMEEATLNSIVPFVVETHHMLRDAVAADSQAARAESEAKRRQDPVVLGEATIIKEKPLILVGSSEDVLDAIAYLVSERTEQQRILWLMGARADERQIKEQVDFRIKVAPFRSWAGKAGNPTAGLSYLSSLADPLKQITDLLVIDDLKEFVDRFSSAGRAVLPAGAQAQFNCRKYMQEAGCSLLGGLHPYNPEEPDNRFKHVAETLNEHCELVPVQRRDDVNLQIGPLTVLRPRAEGSRKLILPN